MKRYDIHVVGAGLFGSIIGLLAEAAGHYVKWYDDLRPMAGSPPSAGLIKPSWLEGFGEEAKVGRNVVETLFPPEVIRFRFGSQLVDVGHINPARVLVRDERLIQARVDAVGDGLIEYSRISDAHTNHGSIQEEGIVVVAAGYWCGDLVTGLPPIKALKGTAFFFEGKVTTPRLQVWAPYKQIKVFNRPGNRVWAGDSTGMSPKTYTGSRKQSSFLRCDELVRDMVKDQHPLGLPLVEEVSGLRPVIAGHRTGFSQWVHPRTFVSTGGGKMGTVLAGYHAHKFLATLGNAR